MARPKHTKKDANHPELVQQLRDLGAIVWDTADLGGEVLDLIVFWRGCALPVEVKPPGPIRFTDGELESMAKLEQVGIQAVVAQSLEDVLAAFDELPFTDEPEYAEGSALTSFRQAGS